MTSAPRSLFVLLAVAIGAAAGTRLPANVQSAEAQAPAPRTVDADPPAWGSEFPAIDRLIWSQQRGALIARRRAERPVPAPGTVEAATALVETGERQGRLTGLRLLLDQFPEQLANTLETMYPLWYMESRDPVTENEPVREFVAAARKRLPDLPKDIAARIAFRLVPIEYVVDGRPAAGLPRYFEAFFRDYGDTAIAPLAEIDLISVTTREPAQQLAPLERIARSHPGTLAGAKALYQKGFTLSRNMARAGTDPLDGFTEVLAIVRELQSGAYPASEWTEKAPDLIIQFNTYKPVYAAGSAEKMLDGYRTFAAGHLARSAGGAADDAITFVVGRKMGELFESRGLGVPAVEQAFADLERVDKARARYLRAEFYIERMRNVPAERPAFFEKARDTLAALYAEGGAGPYTRKALAALASLYFFEGDYANAASRYRDYARSYPRSEFAWVAGLRLGRCEERLGNTSAARAAYRAVAADFADLPIARVLGNTYAGRASDALGQLDQAAREYQRALDDPERWTSYTLYEARLQSLADRTPDASQVTRVMLDTRLSQLKDRDQPGVAILQRGRRLLEDGRPRDALAAFSEAMAALPNSETANEARFLTHRAHVEIGLDLGNTDSAAMDNTAALGEFELAIDAPWDFGVAAAKIAKATVLWKRGSQRDADALMTGALKEWHDELARRPRAPLEAVEQDVADIRALLFTPGGSPLYQDLRLNGFRWPASPSPFTIVSADLSVTLHNAPATRRDIPQRFPDIENVLLLTSDQLELLDRIITKLGGTQTQAPTAVMQVPNQPVGASVRVLDFWNRYFPARPGHWRGWELLTYPTITGIEFLDDARTQAIAHVTIGYGGGTFLLDKAASGRWSLTRTISQWVT